MKEIDIDELKKIQLNILNVVSEYCKKSQIKYFLCFGTLIGAVRHQGYIPWDDDIDIAMLRSDYEKLINDFNGYDSLYKVYTTKNTDGFPYPFAKIVFQNSIVEEQSDNMQNHIGINIDVFPIDNIPDDVKQQKKLIRDIRKQREILDVKSIVINKGRIFYKNAVLYFGKIIFKHVQIKTIVDKIIKLATNYNDCTCENVGVTVWGYGEREIVSKNIFDEAVNMKFEGNYYSVPKRYDEWLSSIYGNYMELPPVEKQLSHHDFKAYVTDK